MTEVFPLMIELNLTHREKSIVVVTAAVTFVAGFWAGIWSVPPQALDVPLEVTQNAGEQIYDPAYRPVPGSLPVVSVVVPLFGFAYAFRDQLVEDSSDSVEVSADD
ncbi:hypothetical protein SG26_08050 [Haloarcula sp. CBA1115]|nr:hypothetical protein SG26_08050 [Haloarcula sp. CBA1115]